MEFHYFDYDTDEVKKDSLCISRQSTMSSIGNSDEYIYTTYPVEMNILAQLKDDGYKVYLHYDKDDITEL